MGVDLRKLDAGKIETALYNFIRPMFEMDDVYVMGGTRNSSKNESKSVYCNAPIEIKDLNAYGKTVARIEIYVKKIDGIKNAAEISRIHDAIVGSLQKSVRIEDYGFSYMNEIPGDDRAGYNFIFINLATLIL